MIPILLILSGLILIGLTFWNLRGEEVDVFFWGDLFSWSVKKTEFPVLYYIVVASQFLISILLILIGIVWLVYS